MSVIVICKGRQVRSNLITNFSTFFLLAFLLMYISVPALGMDQGVTGKSYLLDNLYNPSNKVLTERYSIPGDLLARADSLDVYAQAGERAPLKPGGGGYYGSKDWQAFIIVYLWLSGLNGETGTGNNVSDVDVSFGDIWENFDIGGQAHIEFWWKRWIFFIDPTYMVLTADNNETRVIGSLRSSLKVKMFLFDMAAGYRVAQIPLGSNVRSNEIKTWPSLGVDVYGGGRIFHLDTKLKLRLDTPLGPVMRNIKDDNGWFDFIVGTRFIFNFTEKLLLTVKTDIGGFGLGFSSDIDWNFATNVGYELPWWGITPYVGYRVLYIDYKDGSGDNRFVYKMWQTGPQVGVGVRF